MRVLYRRYLEVLEIAHWMKPVFPTFDKAALILIAQQYLSGVVRGGYVSCAMSNTYLFVPWYYHLQKHLPL